MFFVQDVLLIYFALFLVPFKMCTICCILTMIVHLIVILLIHEKTNQSKPNVRIIYYYKTLLIFPSFFTAEKDRKSVFLIIK